MVAMLNRDFAFSTGKSFLNLTQGLNMPPFAGQAGWFGRRPTRAALRCINIMMSTGIRVQEDRHRKASKLSAVTGALGLHYQPRGESVVE